MTKPPFSPILMGGLLLKAVPPELVQPVADHMAKRIMDRHPDVFERLTPLGPRTFLIDVVDLPWLFHLTVAHGNGEVLVLRRDDPTPANATIRAPLKVLFGLLDGTIDGDAMFFTRDMTFEGDTEAVVALRNALDGADIDFVSDLSAGFGRFSHSAETVINCVVDGYNRLDSSVQTMNESVIDPALRKTEAQQRRIEELEARCTRLEKALRRKSSVLN
jgi:predicted lipid carrier protein YhbT